MTVELVKALLYTQILLCAGFGSFWSLANQSVKAEIRLSLPFLVLGLTAICFLAPNLWVLHALILVAIPLIARTRADVAILLLCGSLAMPRFDSELFIGDLKLFVWSTQQSLAIGALVAFMVARGPIVRASVRWDLPALCLGLLLLVSTARETSFTNVLRETILMLIAYGIPYWVVTRGIDVIRDKQRLLGSIAAVSMMIAVLAVYEAVTSWPLYRVAGTLIDFHGSGLFVVRQGFMRASGPLSNPTILGFVLVLGLLAATSANAFKGSPARLIAFGILSGGILASQSRGAILGAAVGFLVMMLSSPRSLGSRLLLGVGVALLGAVVAGPLLGSDAHSADTSEYRRALITRGIEEFWTEPLLGSQVHAVKERLADLTTGEQIVDFVNSYLYFALTTGALGLALFTLSLSLPLWSLWRNRRAAFGPETSDVARLCAAFLISSIVMLIFTSIVARNGVLLMIALGLAGRSVAAARLGEGRRDRALLAPIQTIKSSFGQG